MLLLFFEILAYEALQQFFLSIDIVNCFYFQSMPFYDLSYLVSLLLLAIIAKMWLSNYGMSFVVSRIAEQNNIVNIVCVDDWTTE